MKGIEKIMTLAIYDVFIAMLIVVLILIAYKIIFKVSKYMGK